MKRERWWARADNTPYAYTILVNPDDDQRLFAIIPRWPAKQKHI